MLLPIAMAKQRLKENIHLQPIIELPLSKALNYALAEAIFSPIDMPPFRQSSMDGYALCLGENTTYQLIGEVAAGSAANPPMKAGQALRILTGARVPDDAQAVLMQEKTRLQGDRLLIDLIPEIGGSIRPQGEQIQKEKQALPVGTVLNAAAIGFLTTLGITSVKVRQKPSLIILVTGDELVAAGQPLKAGQIYESNALMLQMALQKEGWANIAVEQIADDLEATKTALRQAIKNYDFVILTGGISVGTYDYVGQALEALDCKEIFYKVRQKPGKPLLMAKKGSCHIFALPGNPAAALTSFYQYVRLALRLSMGYQNADLKKVYLPLLESYDKKGGRSHFLKAKLLENGVSYLAAQSSAMLSSFALADCFIFIPHDQMQSPKGTLVEVHLF